MAFLQDSWKEQSCHLLLSYRFLRWFYDQCHLNDSNFCPSTLNRRVVRSHSSILLQIQEIASDPDELNVFQVENFDEIAVKVTSDLLAILCERKCVHSSNN